MDNKPEQSAIANPSEPVVVPAIKTSASKTGPGRVLAGLIFVVAIIAVAASVYLWQGQTQQQQQLQRSQIDIAAAVQRLNQQADANRELQRQLDSQADSAAAQQQQLRIQLDTVKQQLASQQKRLLSLSTTDRDDWLLAEAEYLIRLANQRLLMGKEVQGALDLLLAADDIARELDDTALYPVRQALANDIAALRAAAQLDLEGLYLQLGALANQIGQQRLFKLPELTLKKTETATPEDWQQSLQTGLQLAWAKLNSYIQYNRRDDTYKPILAPEYEGAVRQNVHLMFEQAQMAVLSGKQRLYEDSLAKAKDWLSRYYTLNTADTLRHIRRIDELSGQQIVRQLPDISGSLRALKHYVESIHQVSRPQLEGQQPESPRLEEQATQQQSTGGAGAEESVQ